jgi:(2R)-sulfolactate sulfo-lyase subunit beta
MMKIPRVRAYRRENGRVGVRNHVVILPLDDLSNLACEAVGNNIKGTLALPHAYGRLTAAEALGHREFVLTKLYRSA